MIKQVSSPAVHRLLESKRFATLRGRAVSYFNYSPSSEHPEPTAFDSDCFSEFLKEPFLIPVLLDHHDNEIVGHISELHDNSRELTFESRVYDISVFSLRPSLMKFSIGTAYDKKDVEHTEHGLLIKKAIITEISIVSDSLTPADGTAIQF